jgi:intracellular multiplication protein IcmJ
MKLQALMLSASIDTAREAAPLADAAKGDTVCCGFCAQPGAAFPARVRGSTGETIRGCALCFLAEHLERPRIDEEASLIWLPEVSQVVINTLMREIHIRLRTLRETLHAEFRLSLDTEERRRLFHARALLLGCGAAASSRLGTGRPSDLASAMLRLSDAAYRQRFKLLGGLRLLSSGRFFEGDRDIYPEIVDRWRAAIDSDAAPSTAGAG